MDPDPDPDHVSDGGQTLSAEQAYRLLDNMQAALATRAPLGEALGVVRLLLRSDSDTAFLALRQMAHETGLAIAELARLMMDALSQGVPLPRRIHVILQRHLGHSPIFTAAFLA